MNPEMLGGTLRERDKTRITGPARLVWIVIPVLQYHYCHCSILSCSLVLSHLLYHHHIIISSIMPITRKRKAASPEAGKQSQTSINTFGRVTKNHPIDQSVKKRKTKDTVAIPILTSTQETPNAATQKEPGETGQCRKRSRDTQEDEATTPQNKRCRNALPPTPAETPSKSASKLFEKLVIDKSTEQDSPTYDTPPLTPRSFKSLGSTSITSELPAQLQDLTRLFKAFLTSTSLFCAHEGLGTPMYLSTLLPHVTRSWKKRAVTEKDIHTILAILGKNDTFELADNGEGSLCLELIEHDNITTGHFDHPRLTQAFQDSLTRLWSDWTSTSPTARSDIPAFLAQLPACTVIISEVAPSRITKTSKGTERLNELKASALAGRASEQSSRTPIIHSASKSAAAVSSRGSNLLDRILAKQQANLNRANAPTQEQINRLQALDRIPDIVDVLDLLANGRPRASFSTKTLISHLQNSLRNPLSAEEGERCLHLMADEVARGFVGIVQVGSVKGIVVTKAGKPRPDELRQRLEAARKQ
jgi:hypothetical protein